MDTQGLVHQLRYSAWASERVLRSVADVPREERDRDLGNSFGSVHGTLVHIYQADSIWWDRLMGDATPYDRPGVPANLERYAHPPEFADFSKKWLDKLDDYIAWAEKLPPAGWDRIAQYRTLKGDALETPVWQIVLHVVNHATYHRGQITTMLRQLGRNPVGTDLITYYRSL
jgi:uncharacterized damage-inducible protein DinB